MALLKFWCKLELCRLIKEFSGFYDLLSPLRLKAQNKLCSIFILFWCVEDAKIKASQVTIYSHVPGWLSDLQSLAYLLTNWSTLRCRPELRKKARTKSSEWTWMRSNLSADAGAGWKGSGEQGHNTVCVQIVHICNLKDRPWRHVTVWNKRFQQRIQLRVREEDCEKEKKS